MKIMDINLGSLELNIDWGYLDIKEKEILDQDSEGESEKNYKWRFNIRE